MSEQKMIITDAGLAEIINAEASGTAPVVLSHIAFGSGQYTATKTMTALKTEFKRFESIKGGAIDDKTIHLSVHDNSEDTYTVFEVGVFTESGTLFAVYSQTTPIVQKATGSETMFVSDIVFADIAVSSVTVGDTNFILNPATTETVGTVELATEAEAKAGTDATRAITPKTLDATIEAHDNVVHRSGTEAITGQKTFENNPVVKGASPTLFIKQTDVERGVMPTSAQSSGLTFTDTNGKTLGQMQQVTDAATSKIQFTVNKPSSDSADNAYLSLIYPAEGTPYATAPTPATGDNSTKIATTAWVTNANTINLSTAKSYTDTEVSKALTTAKAYTDTEKAKYLPLAGGKMTNQNAILRSVDNSYLSIMGGSSVGSGAQLDLCGKDHESIPSAFQLHARNGATDKVLVGETDGDLTWDGKHIVRSVNGVLANNAGNVAITAKTVDALPLSGGQMTTTKAMTRDVNNSFLGLHGGTGENNDGAQAYLCGANHPTNPSSFQLIARNSETSKMLEGKIDGKLEWDGKYVLHNSFSMPSNTSGIVLNGGTDYESGGYIRAYGKEHATYPGWFALGATDGTNASVLRGLPDGSLTWNGKALLKSGDINTSSFANISASNFNATGKSTIVGWGMPDYSAGIEINANTDYTCPKNGFVWWSYQSSTVDAKFYLNNTQMGKIYGNDNAASFCCVPVRKGNIVKATHKTKFTFYPSMGG